MLVSVSLRTAAISKSNGLSPVLVDPSMRAEVGKLNAIAGNLAIAGSMLSKTSFALTLLRVVMGRIRYLLWAIIVSMNLALFLSILFLLISCKPIEKSWNATLPGTCWPQYVQVRAGLFSSGKILVFPTWGYETLRRLTNFSNSSVLPVQPTAQPWISSSQALPGGLSGAYR